jgi:hypothetical protein
MAHNSRLRVTTVKRTRRVNGVRPSSPASMCIMKQTRRSATSTSVGGKISTIPAVLASCFGAVGDQGSGSQRDSNMPKKADAREH